MDLQELGVTQHNFTLKNGLQILFFERPGMPLHIRASFKAGSRYDPVGKEGLAHFVEHMLLVETKRFSSGTALGAEIAKYGGWLNGATPTEGMYLDIAIGDPADAHVAFEAMGDMLTTSNFKQSDMKSEREAVLGEIGDWNANPSKKIWDVEYRLYFQDTPLGRANVGTTEAVKAIKRSDVINFVRDYCSAGRGLMVVVGGISLKQAKHLSELNFSDLPRSQTDHRGGEVAVLHDKPVMIIPAENQQIQLTFGFRTPALDSPDHLVVAVISAVLGRRGGSSSLFRLLREERGLVYSVKTNHTYLTAGGFMTVETTAAKEKLQPVLDTIIEEFRRLYDGKLTPAEISLAKAYLVKSSRLYLQTSYEWAIEHSHYSLHIDPRWNVLDDNKKISKVTAADVARVGKKYFKPGAWYLGLIGDIKESDFKVNY